MNTTEIMLYSVILSSIINSVCLILNNIAINRYIRKNRKRLEELRRQQYDN